MNTVSELIGIAIQRTRVQETYATQPSARETAFNEVIGRAEMPSAGRGFTVGLMKKLLKKGVTLATIMLHTEVSSLEENETPYPEYMEIDPVAAALINTAKGEGRRVIAVGTICIRAVETAVSSEGMVVPYRGNTELWRQLIEAV